MVVRISAILGRNSRFQSVRESLMRFVSGNRSYTAFRPRAQAFRLGSYEAECILARGECSLLNVN